MSAAIEFRHVGFSYDGQTPVLRDVSFQVEEGGFTAIVGTNGAGKSTVMRLMNGLLKPDAGEVLVDGSPTTSLKTSELARFVGFLFQNPDRQICRSTVRDELLFGFEAQGRRDAHAEEAVEAVLAEFGLDGAANPFMLNRGARQMVALASVVALSPRVLILDEPTTGLDRRECARVMSAVQWLRRAGTTVVMVCHDMELVADYALRCIVMHDGRVEEEGPTRAVLADEALLARASLVPPQIVQVASRLSFEVAGLAGSAVARAFTVDEMEAAVLGCRAIRKVG